MFSRLLTPAVNFMNCFTSHANLKCLTRTFMPQKSFSKVERSAQKLGLGRKSVYEIDTWTGLVSYRPDWHWPSLYNALNCNFLLLSFLIFLKHSYWKKFVNISVQITTLRKERKVTAFIQNCFTQNYSLQKLCPAPKCLWH